MTLLPALRKGQLHSVCACSCCPPIPLEQGNAGSLLNFILPCLESRGREGGSLRWFKIPSHMHSTLMKAVTDAVGADLKWQVSVCKNG